MKSPLKLRPTFIACLLLLAAASSSALTLGRTRGAVLIGRPLDVSIQVRLDSPEETSAQCFEADVFQGETRIDGGRIQVLLSPGPSPQEPTLQVRSSAIVDEPVVTIYLRAGCGQRITRRYVLLADYPTDAGSLLVVPPVAAASSVAALPSLPQPATRRGAAGAGAPAGAQGDAAPPRRRIRVPAPGASAPAGETNAVAAATGQAAPGNAAAAAAVAPDPAAPTRTRPARQTPAAAERVAAAAQASAARASKARESVVRRADSRARLKLEPLDLSIERDPTLRASTELLTAPSDNEAARAQAAALWRAINAEPQDILRDAQRAQALEADVKSLRDQTTRNQTTIGELRGQLSQAQNERYANPLVYALALLLLASVGVAAFFWQRSRGMVSLGNDWWKRGETIGGDAVDLDIPPSLRVPVVKVPVVSRPSEGGPISVDVDLDVDESMFATLKTTPRPVAPPLDPMSSFGGHSEFSASMPGSSRAVNAEELFDIQQQADFFVSLGQYDQAIEVLRTHIDESVETSALAYLDLLKIYHTLQRSDDYEALRADFHKVFNAEVPAFEAFSDRGRGLEAYRNAMSRIEALWPSPKVLDIIEESIFRKPGSGDGEAFDLDAYRELLLLYAMAKDVVERGGSVMDFDLASSSLPPEGGDPVPRFSATTIQPLSASLDSRLDSGGGPGYDDGEDDGTPLPEISLPRPSARIGLDIDLTQPAALGSAFMEIGSDEAPVDLPPPELDLPPTLGRRGRATDLSPPGDDDEVSLGMDSIDSVDSSGADAGKPEKDSHLIDFDLFDPATEKDIAPKVPPKKF